MKSTKTWIALRLLALVAVAVILVPACRSDSSVATTVPPIATTAPSLVDIEEVDPNAIDGGVFRVGLISNITTDNWFASQDQLNTSYNQYLDNSKISLFTLALPGFVYVPEIAATPEPVRPALEGDRWVVEQPIRDDVMWSDGTPVIASDLAFSFDVTREFKLGGSHAARFGPSVLSVTAPDDHLVRLEFSEEPGLAVWQNGVGFADFVPAHFWEAHVEEARAEAADIASTITREQVISTLVESSLADEDPGNDLTPDQISQQAIDDYVLNSVAAKGREVLYAVSEPLEPSAGPAIFTSWEVGESAVTTSNGGYFARGNVNTLYSDGSYRIVNSERGEDVLYGGNGEGEVLARYEVGPFVSEIHWIEYGSKEAAYQALLAGEVDYVWDPLGLSSSVRDQLAADPDVRFSVNQDAGVRYLAFNMRKAPMNDLAFRQAVAAVINKELIAETVLAGAVFPAYTVVHPDLTTFYNPDILRPGWDSEGPMNEGGRFDSAIQILKDAGYTWDLEPVVVRDSEGNFTDVTAGVGLTMPNGEKAPEVRILAPGAGYDPFRATFSIWTAQWMNELGIPTIAEPTDFDAVVDAVFPPQTEESAQQWDMYILGWDGGDPSLPGTQQVGFFHSREDSVTGRGFNTVGYRSSEFDALAEAFEAATDIKTAAELTKQMDALLAKELPYVMLFRAPIVEASRSATHFPTEVIVGGHHGFPNAWPGAVSVSE